MTEKKISYFIKIGEKIIKNKREWKTKKRTRKISDAKEISFYTQQQQQKTNIKK